MLSRFRKRKLKRKSPRRRGTIHLEALEGRVLLDATSQWTQAFGPWGPSDNTSQTDSLVEDLNHIFHAENHEDGQAGIYYSDPTTWDLSGIFPNRRDVSIDELHYFVDAVFGYDDMGILTQAGTGSIDPGEGSWADEPLSQNGGYTVYLDFEGGQLEGRDSDSWLYSYNATIPSYDLSSYGWNGREAESIEMIVNFVQEDYAAYDVTITTQQPAAGEYTTIAIGGTNDWFRPNSGVIGVATYDVGNKYASNTGFAFVEELGVYYNSSGGSLHRFSEYVSNLVSHEAAHTFGANHISDVTALMNPYLPLNPNTAMFGTGTVYGSNKTQDTQTQMGTNVGYAHGPDDYGDTQDSAQPVTVGSVIQAMLERRDDVDTFRFISPKSTTITIDIDTSPFGNLDSQLSVHRWTDMTLLGKNDNNTIDKDASVSFEAVAGEEYLITVSSAAGNSSGRYALHVVNPQPEPNIKVTDSTGTSDDLTVDFGGLTVNTFAQETVTIENTGTADLIIAQLTAGAGFELSIESAANNNSDDLVIEAGGQLTVVVTYHPQEIGSDTATLTIVSNDSDQAITQLSLAGFSHPPQPNLVISADGTQLLDGILDVGSILRGQPYVATFLVTNDGLADLTITEILVTEPVTLSAGWTGSPIQLTPGQSREVSFSVTVDQRGLFESQILIASNDTDDPTTTIDLTANVLGGVLTVQSLATGAEVEQIDFGAIMVGQTAQQSLLLINSGDAGLTIESLAAGNSYIAQPYLNADDPGDDLYLAPGESTIVLVRFLVNQLGPATGTLTIITDNIESPTTQIDLQTNGIGGLIEITETDGLNDGQMDLGRTLVDTPTQIDAWELTNTGNIPVTITLTFADGSDYAVANGNQIVLAAGESEIVNIDFMTHAARQVTDTLNLTADDLNQTQIELVLSSDAYAIIGNGQSYTFIDQSGDRVKLSLSGRAEAEVIIGQDDQPDIQSIEILNGTGKERLNIKVNKQGRTQLGEVSGDAAIKSFSAHKVDLIGQGIELDGLKRLRLGNVFGGADIHLTTSKDVRISLDQVAGDTTIDIDGTLSRLTADVFSGGTIRADRIGRLRFAAVHNGSIETTQGDLENLHVRDGDLNGQVIVQGRLHKITITRGDLNGLVQAADGIDRLHLPAGTLSATVQTSGDIGKINAFNIANATVTALYGINKINVRNAMTDSDVTIGYNSLSQSSPDDASATSHIEAYLRSLTVRGIFAASRVSVGVAPDESGNFLNATPNTADGQLGRIVLNEVHTDNNDDPFGLIGQRLTGKLKINHVKIQQNFQQDDFYIALLNT